MFLIGNRLDDLEVHLGTRPDVGDLTGESGPMPLFTGIALRTAPQALLCATTRLGNLTFLCR